MSLVVHKKAQFEYEIEQKLVAGIVLSGQEVKSVRLAHASLQGSFVKLIGGEAFLLNAKITQYPFAHDEKYDPQQSRKLLFTKRELLTLSELSANKGKTLVPLAFEVVGRRIKLIVGVGRGRKEFEKRARVKEREEDRALQRAFKLR